MTKTRSITTRLLALLALSCATSATAHSAPKTPPPAAAPVRVLTFNILASQPSWEKNAKCEPWAVRQPIVLEVMRDKTGGAPYDFIGTQETTVHPDAALHQVNQLAAALLPDYDSHYAACSGERNGKTHKEFSLSNMIFWRKDRWKIDRADRGTFWLSDTPETPGSNQWAPGGKGGKRNVTYALFHEIADGKRTGRKVYFFNTHLNVHVPAARAKSALLLMERIQQRRTQSAPVILTGDFNARRDSIIYKYLTGGAIEFDNETHRPPLALTEAYAAANPDNPKKPGIDFIFSTAGLRARSATVIDKRRDNIRASDHNAVDALLEWQ
ncbi:MAG: endonuclease/exonuclease/phosphatase family protein [Opitutaceae bacterium]|jgi:endonuclease/exonuclease/phosphatase family metal-dependent hydrolase|nr:endonuclease/exonuclease/phosphatase family protein [Opitutaceae bacterium]